VRMTLSPPSTFGFSASSCRTWVFCSSSSTCLYVGESYFLSCLG
jgi:hypothetical protein